MRRVASCASAMSAAVVTELATHSRPAWRAAPGRADAARSSQAGEAPAAASAGAITQSRSTSWSPSQSRSDSSQVGEGDPRGRGRDVDRAAQLVERDELGRRDPLARELLERGEHVVARLLERTDGADRRRGGVVDLVGETRGEGAQRDERLALTGVALDAASRADEAAEQVDGEGEPVLADAASSGAGSRKTRLVLHDPARAHVDAVLVPRTEAAGPLARRSPWSPSPPPRGRCGARGRCDRTGAPTSRRPGGPRRRGGPPASYVSSVPAAAISATCASVKPSRIGTARSSSTRLMSPPGSGGRGRPTSRPRRRPTRRASSSRGVRRRRRRRPARWSPGRRVRGRAAMRGRTAGRGR